MRARMFLAVGLPTASAAVLGSASCAPKEDVVIHAPPPPAGSGTSMPVATSGDDAPVARGNAPDCGTDEVYEHVCGVMNSFATAAPAPHDRCGTRGSDLESFGRSRVLAGVSMQAKDAALASFAFDSSLTDAWAADYKKMTNGNTPWRAACCYSRCQRIDVVRADGAPMPPGRSVRQTCIPAPVRTSMPSPLAASCPAGARLKGPSGVEAAPLIAGSAEQCCYRTTVPTPTCSGGMLTPDGNCYQHPRGRPLRASGELVVADARARRDWANSDSGEVRGEGDRAAAAAAWAREAAAEHASVAAFSRLSLQLLAFGAPPELLRACHVAAIEEVEHARAAYAIASSLADSPVGPGPLDVARAGGLGSLEELVRETIIDGCVGESAAALEAEQARGAAADARIQAALEVVARDESAHAELAFRVVAWALEVGGEGAAVAAREALASVERGVLAPLADAPDLSAFGLVSAADARAIRAAVVREVAAPCLRAMLDARREPAVAPTPVV